jgi:hypothetical protein
MHNMLVEARLEFDKRESAEFYIPWWAPIPGVKIWEPYLVEMIMM